MPSELRWAFVEDQIDEAESFRNQLEGGEGAIEISVLGPGAARQDLLTGRIAPAGVLMDVDVSLATGEHGTGLGIAQDIRGKQKAREIPDYPIVRFARPEPVAKIIGGDPSSDDLFDLRIQKHEVVSDCRAVQRRLNGVKRVYDELAGLVSVDEEAITMLLGLSPQKREEWSHPALHTRLADGLQFAVHVAAGTFMRGFLNSPGLLIDEVLLAVRLGLDCEASGDAWRQLRETLMGFKFSGAAHEEFERWWARGLEDWWLGLSGGNSLASLTIRERHEVLCNHLRLNGLQPLIMPRGSAGDRPWRLCTLSLEAHEPQCVPVDPSASVRLTSRTDLPAWTDPQYASLGEAVRATDDKRLNRSDLDRLQRKYQRV